MGRPLKIQTSLGVIFLLTAKLRTILNYLPKSSFIHIITAKYVVEDSQI